MPPTSRVSRLAYTLEEVAEAVGVSLSTVRREVRAGHLRTTRFAGCPRVLVEDLRDYLSARVQDPAAGDRALEDALAAELGL